MEYYAANGETWPYVDTPYAYNDHLYASSQHGPFDCSISLTGDSNLSHRYAVPFTETWQYEHPSTLQQWLYQPTHPVYCTEMQALHPKMDDRSILYNPPSGTSNGRGFRNLNLHAPSTASWDGACSEGSSNSEMGYSPIYSPEGLTREIPRSLPLISPGGQWTEPSHPVGIGTASGTDMFCSRITPTSQDTILMLHDATLESSTGGVMHDQAQGARSENSQGSEVEASLETSHTQSTLCTPQEFQRSDAGDFKPVTELDRVLEDEPEEETRDDKDDLDWDYPSTQRRNRFLLPRLTSTRGSGSSKHVHQTAKSVVADASSRVNKSRTGGTNSPRPQIRHRTTNSRPVKRIPAFARKVAPPASVKQKRPFPCIFHRYGCRTEFPNKNEWKRHVAYQHLQLCYYRCDIDDCNPEINPALVRPGSNGDSDAVEKIYNDFNRKDLFTQHVRRMHGPSRNPDLCWPAEHEANTSTTVSTKSAKKKKQHSTRKSSTSSIKLVQSTADDEMRFEALLPEIRARCWHVRRRAPSRSNCPFDDVVFDADFYTDSSTNSTSNYTLTPTLNISSHTLDSIAEGLLDGPCERAWEDRMEHVGRHYEKDAHIELTEETIDEDLVAWSIENGVLYRLANDRLWLVGIAPPSETEAEAETNGTIQTQGQGRRLRGPSTRQAVQRLK